MTQIFNFSAGPAMLPPSVMEKAQREFINWNNQGCSVMEMSHRSKEYIAVAEKATSDLKKLLSVPDNYKILFVHGGGRGQFSAVPLNLSKDGDSADHLVTGSWSKGAVAEAHNFLTANVVSPNTASQNAPNQNEKQAKITVAPQREWKLDDNAAYFHYCPNETVDGVEIDWIPDTGSVPLVADMSSNILSKKIDLNDYGLVYAGAQKNIGPSGLSVVIVREDLLGKARKQTPQIMNYEVIAKQDSMYNTPPTFAWYLAGLVFEWLLESGGVEAMEKRNAEKSKLLYQCIDANDLYFNNVDSQYRSRMNIPFHLNDPELNTLFLKESESAGLKALKGHRIVGGMRASIYNAMPLEGVQALVDFMNNFSKKFG